ncbi:pre-mRNA-splicing factor Cwc21p [[Candida] railenensis]|uniref:Pre-mRNA-splicing factor CWC21 n=1 Tax=[Candida] railenensis TaxID=45579 RepID=A0A9P0QM19_9ASCO|nr:pre-mRNA-splicing factor Cwc21p [[Candida] railenensis]
MSYNGIGLQTPRGSGTSGYVQRNSASVEDGKYQDNARGRIYKTRQLQIQQDEISKANQQPIEQDVNIKEHNMKRDVELKCMELRDLLEDQNVEEELIAKKVEDLRNRLSSSKREKSPIRQTERGDSNFKDKTSDKIEKESKHDEVANNESKSGLTYRSRYSERVSRS